MTTAGAEYRFKQHIRSALRNDDNCAIHAAMRKYGVENFYFEILEDNIDVADLGDKEKYYIKSLCSLVPNGYNIHKGGNDTGAKPVYKVEIGTGEIVCEYPSISAAAAENGIDLSGLCGVCNQREQQVSCGGFLWCFVDEYCQSTMKLKRPHLLHQRIYQLRAYGNEIVCVYESVRDAADQTGIKQPCISQCLSGRYDTAGGFGWCYESQYHLYKPPAPYHRPSRKVEQIDPRTDNVIAVFDSADAAARSIGFPSAASSIRAVCRPNTPDKTSHGYKWRYVNQ